MINTSQHKKK